MTHIDEHILELYVLNSPEVEHRRGEIQRHIAECHGCKTLVDEMIEFHSDLAEELQNKPEELPSPETAIVRSQRAIEPFYEPDYPPIPYQPRSPMQKFRYFVRRHPISTTVSGFGLGAALFALITMTSVKKDTNPAYYDFDLQTNSLRIFNKEDSLLWRKKAFKSLAEVKKQEYENHFDETTLADLDNDGINEIITTIHFPEDASVLQSPLSVFEFNKNLRFKVTVDETIKYRSRLYGSEYGMRAIVVEDLDHDRNPEMYVTANSDRSPSLLAYIDAKGRIVGKYMHFGGINCIYTTDLYGNGSKQIMLGGTNDLGDTVDNENTSAFIAVLDPMKIKGTVRSSPWKELEGIPAGQTELYYVTIPRTSLDSATHLSPHIEVIRRQTDDLLACEVSSGYGEVMFSFSYYFDHSMNLVGVQSSTKSDRVYNAMVEKRLLKGKIDSTYLANLKQSIRYWNGKEWRKEVCRVQYPTVVAGR